MIGGFCSYRVLPDILFNLIKSIHFELVLEKCSIDRRKMCRQNEGRNPRMDEAI
jgi:hypothetical protein